MSRHLFAKSWLPSLFLALMLASAGCDINDFNADPGAEYRDSFLFTKAVATRSELIVTNINGNVIVIGIDTLSDVRISGTKIVRDQTVDGARQHIGDIEIDIVEANSMLSIKTLQPNTSSGRTYQVDYEVLVPTSWKVTVTNVNGNLEITNIRNTVTATTVNGTVNASDISGNANVNVTNGTITGKVYLPENGDCRFSLVNGNVTLLVPRTTSASVSASVTNGSITVSNLSLVYSTNSRISVTGVAGAGKGSIRLSSVNGLVQLVGF